MQAVGEEPGFPLAMAEVIFHLFKGQKIFSGELNILIFKGRKAHVEGLIKKSQRFVLKVLESLFKTRSS